MIPSSPIAPSSPALLALVLGSLAVGRTRIAGLAETAELRTLAAALTAFGATVIRQDDGAWTVDGVGIGGLGEPAAALDAGGSELVLALLMGLAATHPLTAVFIGDATLSCRPLASLIQPLEIMGAQVTGRRGAQLPLAVTGAGLPMPLEHRLTASAPEIQAAILLAALNTPGTSTVEAPDPLPAPVASLFTRFGARLSVTPGRVAIEGQPELTPVSLDLPGDLSLALPSPA